MQSPISIGMMLNDIKVNAAGICISTKLVAEAYFPEEIQ